MATLPPLAPLPPPEVQRSILSEEWELYLDAWILLLGARLEASESDFKTSAPNDESAVLFLTSFYHQLATSGANALRSGPKARTLRKLSYLLTRRLVLEVIPPPSELLDWTYLSEMSCCYPLSSALKKLLSDAWNKHEVVITSSLEKAKAQIIIQLSAQNSSSVSKAVSDIRLLTILMSSLPDCGYVLMAGSDFLDTLAEAYQTHKLEDIRKTLVANIYVGLTSLLKGTRPNFNLLLDQLFCLKATVGVGTPRLKREPTLLSDIICSSDLLARLERCLTVQLQKRGQDLVSSLRTYQTESKSFHHRYQKPKKRVDKGKRPASYLPVPDEIHAHRMSVVSQIQDLFPDLGSGYVVRLLEHYGDNPETIIAHLLDASVSPELQNLDKSEQLPPIPATQGDPLPPKSTPTLFSPLEPRRNVFDKDVDLAELSRSANNKALRFGRANPSQTADDILADRSNHAANKAAIISALATFDSDDDERDDTYDVADVGGTVDATDDNIAEDRKASSTDELDLTLLRAYKSTPSLFARDSVTRRSQARDVLKRESGLTDEAIEGWAVMLNRDPKRLAKLESKLALSAGGMFTSGAGGGLSQPQIPLTSYRRPKDDTDPESGTDGEASAFRGPGQGGSARGLGRGRGRPRGRGRGGVGGRGGSSGEQNSAVSRQRKEENKASRANHNRRQQRAKKVARAGGVVG
ncbi:hypothetical protein BDW66DRAFT_125149 [Aspergillus desertorum]